MDSVLTLDMATLELVQTWTSVGRAAYAWFTITAVVTIAIPVAYVIRKVWDIAEDVWDKKSTREASEKKPLDPAE